MIGPARYLAITRISTQYLGITSVHLHGIDNHRRRPRAPRAPDPGQRNTAPLIAQLRYQALGVARRALRERRSTGSVVAHAQVVPRHRVRTCEPRGAPVVRPKQAPQDPTRRARSSRGAAVRGGRARGCSTSAQTAVTRSSSGWSRTGRRTSGRARAVLSRFSRELAGEPPRSLLRRRLRRPPAAVLGRRSRTSSDSPPVTASGSSSSPTTRASAPFPARPGAPWRSTPG
jgi:hypothetical protein